MKIKTRFGISLVSGLLLSFLLALPQNEPVILAEDRKAGLKKNSFVEIPKLNANGPTRRPNIIVIMTDEHDPGVTGCYGDKIVRTPNLDQLAREGIRFDACYTASPLCAPARNAFTSGKFISRISAWNNSCWIEDDLIQSLPRLLNEAGYQSYLCGKMHFDSTKRYGFTEVGSFNKDFKTGTGKRRSYDDKKVDLQSWQERTATFYTAETSGGMKYDRKVTELATRFLKEQVGQKEPFYLQIGYITPHFPLIAPEELYRHYQGKVPMPLIPAGFLEQQTTNYQHLRRGFGYIDQDPATVQKGRELYWALTEWMDSEVGRLLKSIEECGLDDNTVIVYTSDHGENKGDHGMWWKNTMYEQSARVPLIIRYPERWPGGQVRQGVCSHLDLVATLAEIAGAKKPQDWDGDSMLSYLDNEKIPWKNWAVSEYYAHNIASGFTMYREGSFKYVYHNRFDEEHPGEAELYDLTQDPGEFHNLAKLAQWQPKVREMHAKLIRVLGEEPDRIEIRCRQELAKGYGRKKPVSNEKSASDLKKKRKKPKNEAAVDIKN